MAACPNRTFALDTGEPASRCVACAFECGTGGCTGADATDCNGCAKYHSVELDGKTHCVIDCGATRTPDPVTQVRSRDMRIVSEKCLGTLA